MAIAIDKTSIGEFADNSADTTIAFTTTQAVAANGFIVLTFTWVHDAAQVLSSVSGGGLTWTIDKQGTPGGTSADTAVVSAQAPSGLASSTTITGTLNASSPGGRSVCGTSFTGVATSSELDTTSGPTGYTGTGWATASMSIAAGSMIVACVADFTTLHTSTATSPSVEAHDFGVAGQFGQTTCYRIESSAGSYTVAGTWSGSGDGGICAAAYKAGPEGVQNALAWTVA